jgi:hypothetical protein
MKKRKKTTSRTGVGDEKVYVGEGSLKKRAMERTQMVTSSAQARALPLTNRSLLALQPKAEKVRAIRKKIPHGPMAPGPIITSSAPATEMPTRKSIDSFARTASESMDEDEGDLDHEECVHLKPVSSNAAPAGP